MKKILILSLLFLLAFVVVGKTPSQPPIWESDCLSSSMPYVFYNVKAYGDQLLGTYQYGQLQDFINAGYSITVTVKSTGNCTFSWSRTYSQTLNYNLLRGNTVYDVQLPRSDFSVTVKVESQCVYDSYFTQNVKFVWTKTIKQTDNVIDFGFPSKQICTDTNLSANRRTSTSIYESEGRVSSGTTSGRRTSSGSDGTTTSSRR